MRRLKFMTAVLIAGTASAAFGQTINWTGPTSGNYNTAGNWSGGVVPNGGTLAAVINPAAPTTVALNVSPTLQHLTLGAGHRMNATGTAILFSGPTSTINNAGTITLDTSSDFASLYTLGNNHLTLSGGGTVILDFGSMGPDSGTFTNLNNTIRGTNGFLGFEDGAFANGGTIIQEPGTLVGMTISWRGGADGFVNSGTIQNNAGTMIFSGTGNRSILNTGGRIGAHGTATLQLSNNLLITGGTLQTSGSGLITMDNGLRLDGVSIGGRMRLRNSDVATFTGNSTHSGTIDLLGTVNLGSGTVVWNGGTVLFRADTPLVPSIVTSAGTFISSTNFIGSGTLSAFALRTSGLISNQGGLLYTSVRAGAGGMVHTGTILAAMNSGALYFDGNASNVNLNSATVTIAAAVSGSDSSGQLIVDDTAVVNANSVSLGGELGFAGNGVLNVNNLRPLGSGSPAGRVRFYNGAGRLNIRAGGGSLGTSRFGSMSFSTATTGVFDITDHAVILDSAAAASVSFPRSRIVTAFNAGAWNGPGISSSLAAAASSTSTKTAVGYVRANNIFTSFPATFHGQPVVNSSAILMLYTLSGDANLDRAVNITDFARLAARFNQPADWIDGDFNYDGSTNISDFALLAANFNKTLPGDLPRDVPRSTSVPEPGSLVLVGIAAALKRHRRGRR